MKVVMSPDLKDYLHKKHKEVLEVYVTKKFERLGVEINQLEIKFDAPDSDHKGEFESYDVEGFKVYVEKDLINENKDILIHLEKLLGMKHIEVDGLEIH